MSIRRVRASLRIRQSDQTLTMDFFSTRQNASATGSAVSLSTALRLGLAADGGLYLPASWPRFLAPASGTPVTLADIADRLIGPFAAGDTLAPGLVEIDRDAFNFPAPHVMLDRDGRYGVLELFHGPTAAFKDFGARFLAACFQRLQKPGDLPINILVATSGDTGGAVAAAFHRRPGIRVTVLFPKGLVSPTQERQLTCWGDNVASCAVRGTFDDCQALVKQAFTDPGLRQQFQLSSANSINLGRLLPQAVYYAATSLQSFRKCGEPLSFIIPSGNLGNVFACLAARQMGLPIGDIVLAHNANRPVVDYLDTGRWQPRPSIATLASAMDVGNPSNMERLQSIFSSIDALRAAIRAESVDDATIRARIRADVETYGQVWCPHTATAAEVYARLPAAERASKRWCIVATAHPAKFPEIVEPLIGRKIEAPQSLRDLLARPSQFETIDPTLTALRGVLDSAGAAS
jgi:threonine synthase